MSAHFSHGLATQIETVAARGKSLSDLGGNSSSVLFHALDESRRNASRSSAEACCWDARTVERAQEEPVSSDHTPYQGLSAEG